MRENLKILEKKLNYQFQDKQLLIQALTHRSYSAQNNERLEFLGDAALETVSSIILFNKFPQAAEGILSKMRTIIVNTKSLAKVANQLNLGNYLFLGDGELKSGGHRRENILADAVEAIIGAIFLEQGFVACEKFISFHFAEIIESITENTILKDPKTKLQEFLQGRGLPLPNYELVAQKGPPNDRTFWVKAESESYIAEAQARSKKKAELLAAETLLNYYLAGEKN